jgi:hypothetical protein
LLETVFWWMSRGRAESIIYSDGVVSPGQSPPDLIALPETADNPHRLALSGSPATAEIRSFVDGNRRQAAEEKFYVAVCFRVPYVNDDEPHAFPPPVSSAPSTNSGVPLASLLPSLQTAPFRCVSPREWPRGRVEVAGPSLCRPEPMADFPLHLWMRRFVAM